MVWINSHIPLYRYLEPVWADALCDSGSIRIGNLDYYRSMEGPQGDPLDGGSEYKTGDMFIADPQQDLDQVAALRAMGIHVTSRAKNLTVKNSGAKKFVPGSALCLSDHRENQHFLKDRKCAIVEIVDPIGFAKAITDLANNDLGEDCFLGRVKYHDDRETEGRIPINDPDPFIKRLRFKPESEFRIYWPKSLKQFVDIKSDELIPFVKRIA